jgi:uncharacterized damage-inducible protein DinB
MHITSAEQRYVMRLSGRTPTYGERDGWPGFPVLAQALEESGRHLIDLAAVADPEDVLEGERHGQQSRLLVAVVYVQAINHATEHRSQIATILTQQGIERPISRDGPGETQERAALAGTCHGMALLNLLVSVAIEAHGVRLASDGHLQRVAIDHAHQLRFDG